MHESQRLLIEAATATANAAQDVTATLKARLDDSLKQFESTAKIMTDALFLCELDGTIRTCNPAAGRMFSRTDLVGANVTSLFDVSYHEPKDAGSIWDMISNSSSWLPSCDTPLRGKRSDGFLFWIEPNITQLEWSDHSYGILMIIRNIDPVVALSQSAHSNRQRYKSLFESTSHGIIIEQNDIIVAANPTMQTLFGYSTDDLLNHQVAMLFAPEDKERVEEDLMTARMNVTGVHADGIPFDLLFTAAQIAWNNQIARLLTVTPR
jgi:PAS domain S-box-containing protein